MHILSIALGGCLKAEPVRYGITEDTGGHITYILGEMEALSRRNDVALAEIVTRRFDNPRLGPVHARPEEWVNPKLVIRRIDSGNAQYLAKEALRDDQSAFAAALIAELQSRDHLPDIIHAHFADAAAVAAQVERTLGIPFVYTAHSLGMDKRLALEENAPDIDARIAEEDRAIARARAIVGSSRDECERQLAAYPSAHIGKIHRLVPGITRGSPVRTGPSAMKLVEPFLRDPAKPMVLAIARPVYKKNLRALVDAFASSATLRKRCNLVILAGLREDLTTGEAEHRSVLGELVEAVDRHDLYGSVAYPKSHTRDEVEALYALAAKTRGVFVNPALMEPYGLTLVEAAAHGLPVVATKIGGPQDIVAELDHGLLVDPRDTGEIAAAIERIVMDRNFWERCSRNARTNCVSMDWDSYASGFLAIARQALAPPKPIAKPESLLVSDLDNTLTGCTEGVARFARFLERQEGLGFVVATGRSIVEARRLVRQWGLPTPGAWVTSVGTEIYHEGSGELVPDDAFAHHIADEWDPRAVEALLCNHAGLVPQASYEQRRFKRSYYATSPHVAADVEALLESNGVLARVVFSHDQLVDILPAKAGKAAAMRHLASVWGLAPDRVFAAGDSGNDADMLTACENAILVANHAQEVAMLAQRPNVYVSQRHNASGALEGLLVHHRTQRLRARELARVSA